MTNVNFPEFMIPLVDLVSLIGLSHQSIHKDVTKNNFNLVLIGKKAYLPPEEARRYLIHRGFTYKQKTISLQMLKGGVAKTTTAMNLGIRANMYGSRVLLVDLDQQANLSFAFGQEDPDAPVWLDVIEDNVPIEKTIKEISSTLHIIPSNLNNSMLDRILLSGKRNIASAISQYLQPLLNKYDLIVLDTAPNLSAINTAASCASDIVLLPVTPDKFSFSGLQKTLQDLESIKNEFKAKFVPQVLFTKFDGRETASHELLKLCLANYGNQMVKAFVRVSSEMKNTIRSGRTIFDTKTVAKEDYDLVTREILEISMGQQDARYR